MSIVERARVALRNWLLVKSRAEVSEWIETVVIPQRKRELAEFHAFLDSLEPEKRQAEVREHLRWLDELNANPAMQADPGMRVWIGMLNDNAQNLRAELEVTR